MPKIVILVRIWKPEAFSQTVLPDGSVLTLVENDKIKTFKYGIFKAIFEQCVTRAFSWKKCYYSTYPVTLDYTEGLSSPSLANCQFLGNYSVTQKTCLVRLVWQSGVLRRKNVQTLQSVQVVQVSIKIEINQKEARRHQLSSKGCSIKRLIKGQNHFSDNR